MLKSKLLRSLIISILFLVLAGTYFAEKPYEGIEINIAAFAGGPNGVISGVLYQHRDEWEDLTGAKLIISEVPYSAMYEKILTDLYTGAGRYDGFIAQAWFLGDYVSGDFVVPINDFMEDQSFPSWDTENVLPGVRSLLKWGENWYSPPFDCDQFVLWYRRDVLSDPRWQVQFKQEYGYDLPAPPKTIDQLIDVSSFFNNKDWNDDGKDENGISVFLKKGSLGGYFYGLAMTAPYSVMPGPKVDRFHNIYWFDPETMEPLFDLPGYVLGLEKLKELVSKGGSQSMLSWDLGESWNSFVSGNTVFAINTADIGSMAQGSESVRGNLGATPIPGSYKVWNREEDKWTELDEPNVAGNRLGANWQGMISSYCKHPEVVYHLFSYLADAQRLFEAAAAGWTGVDPTMYSHFLPPYGTASMEQYREEGWNPSDAQAYSNALYENITTTVTFIPYLRIRGTNEFSLAMDTAVNQYLTNQISAEQAAKQIAKDWKRIIDSFNFESYREEYKISINFGGNPTP